MKIQQMLLLLALLCSMQFTSGEEASVKDQLDETGYSCLKAGLDLRSEPSDNAAVLDKIPYGMPLSVVPRDTVRKAISVDGFNGEWRKVKYKDKTGYVVSSYILPVAPPKVGTASVTDYFSQITNAAGSAVEVREGSGQTQSETTTQLYKNGMLACIYKGRQSFSKTYVLPHFTIEQGFLLMRLMGKGGSYLIGENEVFPVKSTVRADKVKATVERYSDPSGNPGAIRRIVFVAGEPGYSVCEISFSPIGLIISWRVGE